MKIKIAFLTILLSVLLIVDASAQTMPLVYSVEDTGATYPVPYLPSFGELPVIKSLPDPFEWADGRGQISHYSDWECRRNEIGAQIQKYEIGEKPVPPDSVTAGYSNSDSILSVNVTVNGKTLTLTSKVIPPSGTGPFPVIIGMNTPVNFILPSSILTSHNIIQLTFNANQVSAYGSPSTSDPYYRLYPNLNPTNTGQYSAWAWGVSRIIDGLELVKNVLRVDMKHIAVAGCSYAGKMALFSGAFDERVALTIALESGGGGATSWRYSHYSAGTNVEEIDNTDYNWFMDAMHQFAGDYVYRLPEDHHELMAMVAPRALYATANPSYTWLSNPSCYVASMAAKQVYKALGIPDRFGFSIVGGHTHCQVPNNQIPEINAFVNKFLFGKDTVKTDSIADSPYNFDLSNWITWSNPVLSVGTSFFGKTTLTYPPDLQNDLDTTITFKWHKANNAEKYIIQLSTGINFTNNVKIDSTTDTVETISGLLKGKHYYWRVQVKSANGYGPWSNMWHFTTSIPLPPMPLLVQAVIYSGRDGWYTLTWNPAKYADQYNIQVSNKQTFTSNFISVSTTDTTYVISGLVDNHIYFWRVQGTNVSGSGPWSVSHISTLPAPTNLALQQTTTGEITLTWDNNASSEDGTIIEREQNPDTKFTILDTLKGNGTQFIDKTIEQGFIYLYRVRVYIDSITSDYSNEVSSNITNVKNVGKEIPTKYSLSQNYPNPFNPTTTINFALPKTGLTKLTIYDLQGRVVEILVNKVLGAGYHEVNFKAGGLSSGVYFYRLEVGNFTQTMKLILLK